MPNTQDLKVIATDVVATIAGQAVASAATGLHVPAPLVLIVAQLGEEAAAETIEWLLIQAEAARAARQWPDRVDVTATRIDWEDSRP